MNIEKLKKIRNRRRKQHVRKHIFGDGNRLRMTVKRSLNHIYVQIINDTEHKTLVSASSLDKDVKEQIKPETTKTGISKLVGIAIAKHASEANILLVAFDRNGYLYHGRVKALAEAARGAGLEF